MTREEAIKAISDMILDMEYPNGVYHEKFTEDESQKHLALYAVKKALRPVSREQVEKMWTGCEKCRDQANWPSWIEKGFVYCPKCGTPLTSWAWEKQVERLEALNDAVD